MVIIFILLSLCRQSVSLVPTEQANPNVNVFAKNLTKVTKELHFRDPLLLYGNICIITTNHSNLLWMELTAEYAKGISTLYSPVVFTTLETFPSLNRRCMLYLIQLDREISRDYIQLPTFSHWNRFGKIIFITAKSTAEPIDLRLVLQFYSSIVLQLGISSSVLLFYNDNTGGVAPIVVDYFRRKMDFYAEGWDSVVTILTRNHFDDLQGFPFNVALSEYKPFVIMQEGRFFGSTIQIIQAICQKLNATCTWWQFYNIEQLMGLVKNERINIILHKDVSLLTPVEMFALPLRVGYCLLVPECKIDHFDYLMTPFEVEVWIVLLILAMGCIVANRILPRIYPRAILETAFFGSSVAEHQMGRIERMTFCALSVLLFVLCEAYLAKMITFMIATKYENHLETVDDFVRSGISVWLPNENSDFWTQKLSEAFVSKSPTITIQLQDDDPIVTGCALMIPCMTAEVFVSSRGNLDRNVNQLRYYLLKERLIPAMTGHSISKLDPFGEKFGDMHRRFFESGLWQFCFRDTLTFFIEFSIGEEIFLKYKELISLWFILAYGYLGCGIVLGGELLITWMRNKKFGKKRSVAK